MSFNYSTFKAEFRQCKRHPVKPLTSFERSNQQAERNKAAQWQQIRQERQESGRDWWRDKDLWAYSGPYISLTEATAIQNIFRECGGTYVSVWQTAVEITREVLMEDMARRIDQMEMALVDLLAKRGMTLEWVKLNPEDAQALAFEVPLKETA